MPRFLGAPQTPRAKTRFENDDRDSIDQLAMEDLESNKPSSPFLNPNIPRSLSASPVSDYARLSPCQSRAISPAPYAQHPRTWKAAISQAMDRFWSRNRGVILVAVSQLFGALMNLAARLLELEAGMHPLQILFVRMSSTTVLSCLYMWWNSVPDFPLGPKGLRGVLIVRGITGFFGIYGMWYSMMYLPLAEATVITFLAPMLSGYICHVLLKDPFTRKEQLASLIALAGVVLIARPTSLFGHGSSGTDAATTAEPPSTNTTTTTPAFPAAAAAAADKEPTPAERLSAILVALLGVLGAAGAFTTIRWIGQRAHALITVTYFSVWSTLVSTGGLLLAPVALGVAAGGGGGGGGGGGALLGRLVPAASLSAYQWFLLAALGLCGFVMQFMMTAGIGGERSNRATAMVYTHMLFAAGFDRWVFGHQMGVVSLVGCGLIVGSAVWAALGRKTAGEGRKEEGGDVERGAGLGGVRGEEGVPILMGEDEDEDENEEVEGVHRCSEGIGR
ncbi:hypothetical protein VTK56DRAFT_7954 [Thermocarpiscus australiensis]